MALTWASASRRWAAAFYSGLFGWETEPIMEDGKLVYVTIRNAGSQNGGFMPMTEQHGDASPHWLACFTVPSCDDPIARVQELGGGALARPIDLPAGSRS